MQTYAISLPIYGERIPAKLEDFVRNFSQLSGFFMQVTQNKIRFLGTFTDDSTESSSYSLPITTFSNPKGQVEQSNIGAFASMFNRMSALGFTHVKNDLSFTVSVEDNTTGKYKGAKKVFQAKLEYNSMSSADIDLLRL